jgi:cytochrome c peroxidase
MRPAFVAAAAGLLAAGAAATGWLVFDDRDYRWQLPDGMPAPPVPADNPMSERKVLLGRRLFYDTRLSANGTTACATCHRQQLAFTDGRPRAVGATGEVHPRGAMTLVNAAYASRLTWANHLLDRLEVQALTPLFGDKPVEMGMAGRESQIEQLIRSDVYYSEAFPAAFPADADPFSILNTVRALAAFARSIVSFDSPYDRYVRGDEHALSASEIRGMALFFSEQSRRYGCLSAGQHGPSRPDRRAQGHGAFQGALVTQHRSHGTLHARRQPADPGRSRRALREGRAHDRLRPVRR